MGKIVAIGGGELGVRPGTRLETLELDTEIVRLSCKNLPKLLFIPTASTDSEPYCNAIRKHFGKTLHCEVDVLFLFNNQLTKKEIAKKIMESEIIYVGGGNTLKMLIEWRKRGVDEALLKAYNNGTVLSGLSAGAICWFRLGSSDSRKFSNPDAGLIKIKGLNLIRALCCPHYDVEKDRREHVKQLMSKTPGVAIALDNCSAIECVDDNYRIITSKNTAKAFKVYWRKGIYHEERIEQTTTYQPLELLLAK